MHLAIPARRTVAAPLALLALAGAAQAALPAGYHLVDLGANVSVLDRDTDGRLAGYLLRPSDPSGHEFPMLIGPDGQRTMLDGGAHGGVVHGLSGARAVGQVRKKPMGNQQPVLWPDAGAPVMLAVPPGVSSALARTVTPDGTIFGTGGNAIVSKCLRWTGAGAGSGGVVDVLAADCIVADGNDAGQLALQLHGHAGVWRDGQAHDLGALPGSDSSFATAINAAGHLSAYGADVHGHDQPLWSDGQRLVALPGLGGQGGQAMAINDLDEVAGIADDAAHHDHPFVHAGGQTVAIDGLIDNVAGWRILDIAALANDGTLVASALFKRQVHTIRLDPIAP